MCALPVDEAVKIATQICAGLREAHLQGIVHRDLKPANIMIDAAGNVKIMDFGIARLAQENVQHTGTIAGTPSYMAPEQVNLQPVGPRTDIYSVGLLMYEMVVGKQAFEGENSIVIALKQLNEAPRKPREIVPTLPARVEDVILKCLEKDPAKRFQSVDEFEYALAASMAPARSASLANAMETDLRRAGQNIHALMSLGVQKARPAVPVVVAFTQNAKRATERFELRTRYKLRDGFVHFGGMYRRWLGFTSKGQAATASLAVGFLLVGVVAFARSSRNSYASAPVPAAAASVAPMAASANPSETLLPVAMNVPAETSAGVRTETVDLSSKIGVTEESDALATTSGDTVTSAPAASVVTEAPKATPSVAATAVTPTVATAPAKTRAPRATNKNAKAAGNHATLVATSAPLPLSAPAESLASTAKLSPAPVPATDSAAVKPAASADAGANKATTPVPGEAYLEVASYKDQLIADQTVSELSKQGMHAFSVQKSHLWMETFHVEVGPFANSVDEAAAQKELAAKGFKAHPSK